MRKKLLGNSLSILINRLAQSLTTFALTTLIARWLGAESLGQYLLAFSYYFIFVYIASQGLRTLITRELSQHETEAPAYLINGSLLQFLLALVGYTLLVGVVYLCPYRPETSAVCYIMGLAIFPFSLSNITEAVFQAREQMHWIALSTVPVYILRLPAAILAMQMGYGVPVLAAIYVVSETIILFAQWFISLATLSMSVWKLDGTVLKDIFWKSKTFFAIESIAVLNDRMQTLILSFFGSEALVGLYGAVIQLIQPFYIVSHSLSMAVFPGLTKAVEMGREQQKRMAEGITTALLCISLPLFVGSLFVGKDVLSFLYGDASFTAASGALSVSVLAVVLTSFARPLTYVLVANGLERINLYQVVVTSFTGAIVGVVLVSNYQLMGAAIAAVLMSILNVTIYIYAVFSRLFKIDFWSTLQAPLAIGTSMIPVFSILGATVRSVPIGLILASAAYCAIAAAVGIWSVGGPKGLRSQLFQRS